MKTITVTADQPKLRKLVKEAFGGSLVVLAYGDKRVKLERYAAANGAVDVEMCLVELGVAVEREYGQV